jgi:hypothetical protein
MKIDDVIVYICGEMNMNNISRVKRNGEIRIQASNEFSHPADVIVVVVGGFAS